LPAGEFPLGSVLRSISSVVADGVSSGLGAGVMTVNSGGSGSDRSIGEDFDARNPTIDLVTI